jgi:AraC family transcriptional activator of tynA and feaB
MAREDTEISHFSTRGLAREKRLAAWAEVVEALYGKFVTEPGSRPFEARLDPRTVGGLTAIRSIHNARAARRTSREITETDPRCYFVILQLSGRCEVEQNRHKCVLMPGDMTLLDSGKPCSFTYEQHTAQFTLFVPRAMLDSRGIAHRASLAVAVRGAPAALIGPMLRVSFGAAHSWSDAHGAAIADALINLISATWAQDDQVPPPSHAMETPPLVLAIQGYIINNLGSGNLTPASIAAEFGLSVRHLHRLFESIGATIGYWIRRARLDRCATDLLDEALLSQNVTDIGFRWGFTDSAHFSRLFKAEFGESPRQYRQQRMAIRPPSS